MNTTLKTLLPESQRELLPKRVTLITPPSIFLLDQRVFVNLGILKIASILEEYGVMVEHLDLSGVENFLTAVSSYLKSCQSTVVGITTTTPQLPTVVKLIHTIRSERPDLKVILGGPHVTLTHSAVKLEKKANRTSRAHQAFSRLQSLADVLVSGDGELAVFRALQPDAAGLIDGDDPREGLFLSNETYNATPFPARHLVNLSSYRYEIEGHRSTSLIAQLGCPFACGFCGGRNSKSLRVIRTRTAQSIVEELETLHTKYGYTGFMFYDDELNVNKGMIPLMNEIARLQERLKVEFRLRGFVKSELFTREQAEAMFRAGFRWLLSGFESGSERILQNINKKATLEENTRTIRIAREAGLKVKALMSIGHPGESEETVQATKKWLLQVHPDDFDCSVITTYPGTPYYDESLPHGSLPGVWTYTYARTGDRLHAYEIDFLEVADYYKGDPNGGYRSFVFTDYLSAIRIVELRNELERSVRESLQIPYPRGVAALRYEHSMGQGANPVLPDFILRKKGGS